MKQVIEKENPVGSLLAEQAQLSGYYTDCFSIHLEQSVTLPEFMNAFYTTPLFRLERLLLSLTVKGRMTDANVTALSRGEADRLAIWQVEARKECEILLSAGRTKSWLMVAPQEGGGDDTQLFFGSVVVPEPPKREGDAPRLGPVFDSLLSAHRIYSRLLLSSAAQRLS